MLLTIDPGVRICGVALWQPDGQLHRAELVRGAHAAPDAVAWIAMATAVFHATELYRPQALVIEQMRTYEGRAAKGDANDLIAVAHTVGAIVMRLRLPTVVQTAQQWKGGTPKSVTENRMNEKLSPAEKERIIWPAKSLRHNVTDAIGIGLRHLRR